MKTKDSKVPPTPISTTSAQTSNSLSDGIVGTSRSDSTLKEASASCKSYDNIPVRDLWSPTSNKSTSPLTSQPILVRETAKVGGLRFTITLDVCDGTAPPDDRSSMATTINKDMEQMQTDLKSELQKLIESFKERYPGAFNGSSSLNDDANDNSHNKKRKHDQLDVVDGQFLPDDWFVEIVEINQIERPVRDNDVLRKFRYKRLTEHEQLRVRKAINGEDMLEVLIKKFNTTMDRSKMVCLKPGTWLNDEV